MQLLQREIFLIRGCFLSDIRQNYCILPKQVNPQTTTIQIAYYKFSFKINQYQISNSICNQNKIFGFSQITHQFSYINLSSFQKQRCFDPSPQSQTIKSMEKHQNTSLKDALSKQEVQNYFSKMFEDQSNTECYQCGEKSKQWADRNHAIFLCLNCAPLYKQLKWAIDVKSIGLDLWSKKELDTLALGGNRRFKEFMTHYQLDQLSYKEKLKTKAAQYYRILLIEEANGRQAPQPLTKQDGRKVVKDDIPFVDMSPEQMLEFTKQKAFWLGSKTKQFGSKAATKIQRKVTSGQLKEDAKNVAKQVSTKAKYLWSFALSKVKQLSSKKEEEKKIDPQL